MKRAAHLFETDIGPLYAEAADDTLVCLRLAREMVTGRAPLRATPLLLDTEAWVHAYLMGENPDIQAIPLGLFGPPFRLAVYEQIRKIPYGQVMSYGAVAGAAGRPLAMRAVGTACRQCPVFLLVPCQRVISGDGSLGGFGTELDLKRQLLQMEGVYL